MSGRNDWERFDAASIPTKEHRPELEAWLDRLAPGCAVLDLGCGNGGVSRRLVERGFSVVGVDVNERALANARETVPGAPGTTFHRRDVAAPEGLRLEEAPFDAVVCQLVLSIVGGERDRTRLLANARAVLRPGGYLYASASGVSGGVNDGYRRLYEEDFPHTGEKHTYLSRDAAGNVLYQTHHFEEEELRRLLVESGFGEVEIRKKLEASSRRSGEAAYFLYAFARAGEPLA